MYRYRPMRAMRKRPASAALNEMACMLTRASPSPVGGGFFNKLAAYKQLNSRGENGDS